MRNRWNREAFCGWAPAVLLGVVCLAGADAHAQDTNESAVFGELHATVASQYNSRGERITEDEPVLQLGGALTVYDLSAWVWSNLELLDGNRAQGAFTEVALGLDWARKVGAWALGVGVQECINPGAGSSREAYVSVAYETLVTPQLQLVYEAGDVHGLYGELALSHLWTLSEAWSLETRAHLGVASAAYADAYWGVDAWALHDAGAGMSLGWQLHPDWTITPTVQVVSLLDAAVRQAAEDAGSQAMSVVGSLAAAWSF